MYFEETLAKYLVTFFLVTQCCRWLVGVYFLLDLKPDNSPGGSVERISMRIGCNNNKCKGKSASNTEHRSPSPVCKFAHKITFQSLRGSASVAAMIAVLTIKLGISQKRSHYPFSLADIQFEFSLIILKRFSLFSLWDTEYCYYDWFNSFRVLCLLLCGSPLANATGSVVLIEFKQLSSLYGSGNVHNGILIILVTATIFVGTDIVYIHGDNKCARNQINKWFSITGGARKSGFRFIN